MYICMHTIDLCICNVMDVEIKPTMTMLKSKKKRVHSAKKRAKTILSQNIQNEWTCRYISIQDFAFHDMASSKARSEAVAA